MYLRLIAAENRVTGYYGDPKAGGISNVIPISLQNEYLTADTIEMISDAIFAKAGSLKVQDDQVRAPKSITEKVFEWEAFMVVTGQTKRVIAETDELDRDISLSSDVIAALLDMSFLRPSRGHLFIPGTGPQILVGSPISGLDAVRVQEMVSRTYPVLSLPAGLDIERARTELTSVDRPSSRAVLWYASGSGTEPQDRSQVAASFPVLAGMIAESTLLSRAVDLREPIQQVLTETTGLGKGALKRIQKLTVPLAASRLFADRAHVFGVDAMGVNRQRRFNIGGTVSLETSLRHISELPPDRAPQDNLSWKRYNEILAGVAIPIANVLNVPVIEVLAASKGDWNAFHASLARSADFDAADFDRRALALTMIDAIEAIDDFSRTAVLPQLLASIESTGQDIPPVSEEFLRRGFEVSAKIFLGNSKNVAGALFEAARRYASRIPALMDAASRDPVDEAVVLELKWQKYGIEGFPLLTRSFRASNGLVVRPLENFAEMRQESSRLSHCVGRAYLSKARQANCHIFSIQASDLKASYSTFEIDAIKGETEREMRTDIRTIQHRAKSNGNPLPPALLAYGEWMQQVKSGGLTLNHVEVMEWKEHVRLENGAAATAMPKVSWKSALECDWTDSELRAATWTEWRHVLGGDFGKSASSEVIYREKTARELTATMNPMAAALLIERTRLQSEAPAPVVAEHDTPGL